MAGFTIPNTPEAYNQNQAEPDSLDFQVLGNHNNGVISGMVVSLNSNGIVDVAAGEVLVNGAYYSSSQGTVTLTAYSTAPFFDVVIARLSGGAITLTKVAGPTDNPRYPSAGTGATQINDATDVVLAAVWRDSTATTANHIVDKRMLLRTVPTRVSSTPPSGGTDGDLFVNTNWGANTNSATNLDSPLSVKVGSTYYNLLSWPTDTNNIVNTGSISAGSFITTGGGTAVTTSGISATSLNLNNGNITSVNQVTATTVNAALNGNASTATLATKASTLAMFGGNGTAMTFNFSGFSGQPTWVWGSNDGVNHYVWNPSNFNVNYAVFAGYSASLNRGAAVVMNANGLSGIDVSAHLYPLVDNAHFLGLSTPQNWASVWAYGYFSGSDGREKTNIKNSELGLDFIKSLRPVSYTWLVGGREVTDNGVVIEKPGTRTHYGFIAQEVKEAVNKAKVNDFGGWILTDKNDPNSRQGLSIHEFVAPIVKAIQELAARVETLEAK